jgi:hypothetical protein
MCIKYISAKYERARAQAHQQFYYSMRDHWAIEERDQALEMIDYLQSRELHQYKTQRDAVASRKRELNLV